jgi:predicted DNA-binding protein
MRKMGKQVRMEKAIKLDKDVYDRLGTLIERKGETYSDIVRRLIEHYDQSNKKR